MTDAGYVLSGWVITAAALGGYLARVWVRSRRARRMLGPSGVRGVPGVEEADRWR